MRRLVLFALFSFAAWPAFASGQLDARFDDDGVLIAEASISGMFVGTDSLRAGLIDSAGRHVGVGFAIEGEGRKGSVLRVMPSGAFDASFGSGGIVRIPPLAGYDQQMWTAVAEQPDGKLVLAGYSGAGGIGLGNDSRAYVCRLQPSGSLDPDFGTGGCTQPPFWFESNNDKIFAMALQSDGRVVLLGWTVVTLGFDYVVARLNTDGSLDRCFGDVTCQTGGVLIEPEADLPDFEGRALALAPDGRIVLAGNAAGNLNQEMATIRLLPTGGVDQGFGNGGHRLVGFDQGGQNRDVATAVTVADNGEILVAGTVENAFGTLIGVARLDANGTPIPGFGTQGRALHFFNDVSQSHLATRVLLQDDGKLLVAGHTDEPDNGAEFADCGILRLLPDGELDDVFGVGGKLNLDAGLGLVAARPDACHGLAVDGRAIALFGTHRLADPDREFSLLIRLDRDDLFRDGFEN